jgi:hypothetical protein
MGENSIEMFDRSDFRRRAHSDCDRQPAVGYGLPAFNTLVQWMQMRISKMSFHNNAHTIAVIQLPPGADMFNNGSIFLAQILLVG